MRSAIVGYIVIVFMLLGLISYPSASFSQLVSHSFEQVDSLQITRKKPIVVFIHTRWCKYCWVMRDITLKDGRIIDLLNKNYYFVEFDAEDKRPIIFNKRRFNYQPTGSNTGLHQLASALGEIDGLVSFPVLCLLNADYEIIFQYNQYLCPKELIPILEQLKCL